MGRSGLGGLLWALGLAGSLATAAWPRQACICSRAVSAFARSRHDTDTNPLNFALTAARSLSSVRFPCRLLLALLPILFLQSAVAADCRAEVRALLVQPEPAAASVADAQRVCTAASAAGDPVATYHLALLDLGPAGWHPERATPLIMEAAEAGVPEAQYWLAWQLDSGPLLPNNPAAARGWYEAAAAQSHRLALLRLAEVYERGELGARVAPARAADLRELAAQCPANQE